ncbi:MAG: HesA/MoeB/ThiF family protein [Pseudomonadota bacterium]
MSTKTKTDLERHKRHLLLKEIGGPGVQKLAAASVSIVGAGALGGPCAMYLAAAGVGAIEIWDDDRVDRSNLQRQIQFHEADIGKLKSEVLATQLSAQNKGLRISTRQQRYLKGEELAGDILIDATDNYETRFALNRIAHETGRPLVHGAAARWTGQVSVFASGVEIGAPCYECWVPEEPLEAEACDDVGVVGPVTGIVATHMALETLKLITGAGGSLVGRLLLIEGLTGNARLVGLGADAACPVCS